MNAKPDSKKKMMSRKKRVKKTMFELIRLGREAGAALENIPRA